MRHEDPGATYKYYNKLSVDDFLVNMAEKEAIIATQDQALKKRIKAINGQLIVIRQQKRLIFA